MDSALALNTIKTLSVMAIICTVFNTTELSGKSYQVSSNKDQAIQFSTSNIGDQTVFYAYSGNQHKTGILFIHGTPGGWRAFKDYLEKPKLQQDFFMVSIDRPGWGNSKMSSHQINGDFSVQSLGIVSVLKKYPNKTWTVIGHSLGASIAPQISIDYPHKVTGLLLLAGSLKPSLGAPRWYNYAANTWLISNLLSDSMEHSNREIMTLRKQLKRMDQKIKTNKFNTKMIIMQGMKDRLVSPKNPDYAMKHWGNNFSTMESLKLTDEGHFLPWKQLPKVIELIYKLAEKPI